MSSKDPSDDQDKSAKGPSSTRGPYFPPVRRGSSRLTEANMAKHNANNTSATKNKVVDTGETFHERLLRSPTGWPHTIDRFKDKAWDELKSKDDVAKDMDSVSEELKKEKK